MPSRSSRSRTPAVMFHDPPFAPSIHYFVLTKPPLNRPIILTIATITILIVLFRLFDDVPVDFEYYRKYTPGKSTAHVPVTTNNDKPQEGYFKTQPEWDWTVPDYSNGWKGYARKPRNRDIVVLTASDGGGHNSAIPRVLERVLDNREKYCARKGYTNLWLNTSRYDIGQAHRVSDGGEWRRLFLLPYKHNKHLLTYCNCRHGPRFPPSLKHLSCTQTPSGSGSLIRILS